MYTNSINRSGGSNKSQESLRFIGKLDDHTELFATMDNPHDISSDDQYKYNQYDIPNLESSRESQETDVDDPLLHEIEDDAWYQQCGRNCGRFKCEHCGVSCKLGSSYELGDHIGTKTCEHCEDAVFHEGCLDEHLQICRNKYKSPAERNLSRAEQLLRSNESTKAELLRASQLTSELTRTEAEFSYLEEKLQSLKDKVNSVSTPRAKEAKKEGNWEAANGAKTPGKTPPQPTSSRTPSTQKKAVSFVGQLCGIEDDELLAQDPYTQRDKSPQPNYQERTPQQQAYIQGQPKFATEPRHGLGSRQYATQEQGAQKFATEPRHGHGRDNGVGTAPSGKSPEQEGNRITPQAFQGQPQFATEPRHGLCRNYDFGDPRGTSPKQEGNDTTPQQAFQGQQPFATEPRHGLGRNYGFSDKSPTHEENDTTTPRDFQGQPQLATEPQHGHGRSYDVDNPSASGKGAEQERHKTTPPAFKGQHFATEPRHGGQHTTRYDTTPQPYFNGQKFATEPRHAFGKENGHGPNEISIDSIDDSIVGNYQPSWSVEKLREAAAKKTPQPKLVPTPFSVPKVCLQPVRQEQRQPPLHPPGGEQVHTVERQEKEPPKGYPFHSVHPSGTRNVSASNVSSQTVPLEDTHVQPKSGEAYMAVSLSPTSGMSKGNNNSSSNKENNSNTIHLQEQKRNGPQDIFPNFASNMAAPDSPALSVAMSDITCASTLLLRRRDAEYHRLLDRAKILREHVRFLFEIKEEHDMDSIQYYKNARDDYLRAHDELVAYLSAAPGAK